MTMKKIVILATAFVALASVCYAQDVVVQYNTDIHRYCLTNTRVGSRAGNIELGGSNDSHVSYEGTWYYVVRGLNDMFGVIASSDYNRWLIESQYTDIRFLGSFNDYGLFAIKKKGSWGVADHTGKVIIPCQFKDFGSSGEDVTFYPWDGKQFTLRYHDIVNGTFQLP